MGGLRIATVLVAITVSLSGCAPSSDPNPSDTSLPTQSIDPSLIPDAAPADATLIDPIIFDSGYGEYTFKVGDGPAWCTINKDQLFVICEQDEVNAVYEPIDTPATCDYSYGYQFRLRQDSFSGQPFVDLPCSGGAYADATSANILNDREVVKVGNLTCWVDSITVRCDNARGNYIALGPDAWAIN
jgi:hypothetical protein